jgi:hypothetical protein
MLDASPSTVNILILYYSMLVFQRTHNDECGGWLGKMDNVASELHSYPNEYAAYLNKMWKERGGGVSSATTVKPSDQLSLEKIEDAANTKSQVKNLVLDDTGKLEVQQALYTLWRNINEPDKTRGDLRISDTSFSSYGQSTEMILAERKVTGLVNTVGVAIEFPSLSATLEVINFINYMKHLTKEEGPIYQNNKPSPFSISS